MFALSSWSLCPLAIAAEKIDLEKKRLADLIDNFFMLGVLGKCARHLQNHEMLCGLLQRLCA